ncbi:Uma2 family endonuclease [Aquisphaera insulae]|uniref:Uma2 family endonuclease n=1 Tax=Aquisphaera insulae TaxID=2712864 RepID=UPI0013EDA83A|nr:Uma2 family endonuclease [Aquisphaera insulae]
MSTATPPIGQTTIPPLRDGDVLTRDEFERRYDAMPELKKAQLIEGVVHVDSPVSSGHFTWQIDLATWLGVYKATTPGVTAGDNGSVRLDPKNEYQPDLFLMIEASRGGRARIDADGIVSGSPELAVEIAVSSASRDATVKRRVYERVGVREYLLWRVRDRALDWFILRDGRFEELSASEDGIIRSECFPGLWLDREALLRGDLAGVLAVLQRGIASPEHAAIVDRPGTA